MKEKGALYRGTGSELYLVAGITVNMGITNLDGFAAYNGKYTPAFFAALQTAAEEAEAMPDHSNNQATSTRLRNAVIAANNNFCLLFATLIGYIRNSFTGDDLDAMKKLAGSDLYADAVNEKWSAASAMTGKAESFIDSHSAALTAGGMPEDFPSTIGTAGDRFGTALSAFTAFKGAAASGTNAKIGANNNLYMRVQAILQDAKIVFAADAAMRKQCSYTAQLKKVKGPGKSGFRMVVKATGTFTPITTANISFMPTGKSFAANEKGIIKGALPEGTYNFTLTAPGYQTVHHSLDISTGAVRHKKIEMATASALVSVA